MPVPDALDAETQDRWLAHLAKAHRAREERLKELEGTALSSEDVDALMEDVRRALDEAGTDLLCRGINILVDPPQLLPTYRDPETEDEQLALLLETAEYCITRMAYTGLVENVPRAAVEDRGEVAVAVMVEAIRSYPQFSMMVAQHPPTGFLAYAATLDVAGYGRSLMKFVPGWWLTQILSREAKQLGTSREGLVLRTLPGTVAADIQGLNPQASAKAVGRHLKGYITNGLQGLCPDGHMRGKGPCLESVSAAHEVEDSAPEPPESLLSTLRHNEAAAQLHTLAESLGPAQRELLNVLLRLDMGDDYGALAAAADELGIRPGAARARWKRIRDDAPQLAQLLEGRASSA